MSSIQALIHQELDRARPREGMLARMLEAWARDGQLRPDDPTVASIPSHLLPPSLKTMRGWSPMTGEALAGLTTTAGIAGAAGFPREHVGVTLARVEHRSGVRETICGYLTRLGTARERGVGLVLEGAMGTGKTSVLSLVAEAEGRGWGMHEDPASSRHLYEKTPDSHMHYCTMPRLARALMERVSGPDRQQEWRANFAFLCEVPLLFLDEFNTFYLDSYGQDKYFELMDTRLSNARLTCTALNGTLADLRAHPVQGRIIEKMKPRSLVVRFPGESRRTWASLEEL